MIINRNILICLIILLFAQVIIWFQLNAQLKWPWFKDHAFILSVLGVPISYLLIYATRVGYLGFGELWPVRFMGFATSMMTFPIITWFIMGEGFTMRTIISLLLATTIMLIQFTK